MFFPASALAAVTCFATAASADVQAIDAQQFRGMASAWPMGIVLTGLTPSGAPGGVLVKAPGDQNGPMGVAPAALTAASAMADDFYFALAALDTVVSSKTTGLADAIAIDAISTGNAILPALGLSGENLDTPQLEEQWMAMAISVEANSQAVQITRRGAIDQGSEVIGYYARESDGIGTALPGRSPLEAGRAHMGLPPGGADDIGALDIGLGMQRFAPSQAASRIFSNRTHLYFSVTSAWAAHFNLLAPGNFAEAQDTSNSMMNTIPVEAHEGDIYVMYFKSGTSGAPGVWEGPFQWASAEKVGFFGGVGDIDGLDVDLSGQFIFSPKKGNEYDVNGTPVDMSQLMYADASVEPSDPRFLYDPTVPLSPRILKDFDSAGTSTAPIADITGTRTPPGVDPVEDEIDAVCSWDPESIVLDHQFGTPGAHTESGNGAMGLSLILESAGATDDWIGQVTGWGEMTPVESWLSVHVRLRGIAGAPDGAWFQVHGAVRKPTEETVPFVFRLPDNTGVASRTFAVKAFLRTPQRDGVTSWVSEFVQ